MPEKKLALGTVQFGLDYGISNTEGQTELGDVFEILSIAKDAGISVLDTAHLYGDSERVIGESKCADQFKIITKTPHFSHEIISKSDGDFLEEVFLRSVSLLGTRPNGLLIHSGDDLIKQGGELLFERMMLLRLNGLVDKIGVSVYSPEQCIQLCDQYPVDLIQLPLNIYDQRFLRSGVLDKLVDSGIEIHVRSAFLQGLLLMGKLPTKFSSMEEHHQQFLVKCSSVGMRPFALALNFVMSLPQVKKVVVGVNSSKQLLELLKVEYTELNVDDFLEFSVDDESFVNPTNW